MTASEPLVSIVTPLYNEERYLRECIESIQAQTYQNWEYTILDNCSTDRSPEIAREYAAKDSRIKIRRNEQLLPPIVNHNAALQLISPESKYSKVVFADDWIFPECLKKMVEVAESHPSVALVGAYCLEAEHVICTGLPFPSHLVSGQEICRRHLLDRLFVFGSANSVLYRADVVRRRNPFFNEANIHGDTETCFELLKDGDFGFVHQVLTFTRVRPGSLTMSSEDRGTYFPSGLRVLTKHGRSFLTQPELKACIDRQLSEYYGFLGKRVIFRRDKDFWTYHRAQLSALGFPLDHGRVMLSALRYLGQAMASPRASFEKLVTRKTGKAMRTVPNV